MKTSLILLATATAVPFFMLLGLSGIAAFSIMTALSIGSMIGLDYDNSRSLSYAAKKMAPVSAKVAGESHPLAA